MSLAAALPATEWTLSLTDACAPGKALAVHLRESDGAVVAAFALAPGFCRSWGRVEAAGLRWCDGAWQGQVQVDLPSDGWVPKPDSALRFTIDVAGDGWQGRRQTVAGTTVREDIAGRGAVVAESSPAEVDEAMTLVQVVALAAHPRPPGAAADGKRAKDLLLRAGLEHGAVGAVLLREKGSPVDTSSDLVVTGHDLRRDGGRLVGGCTVEVRHQADRWPTTATLRCDLQIIRRHLAGELRWTGADGVEHVFPAGGDLQPAAAAAAEALVLPLVLHGVLEDGADLECYLDLAAGRVRAAFATGPNRNNATHVVDAGGLTWADGRLGGALAVVVQADPWVPADGRPVAVTVQVAVERVGPSLRGTYRGWRGAVAVAGVAEGLLSPPAGDDPPRRCTIKFEDGLLGGGGDSWLRRVFVGAALEADGALAAGGRVSNNHSTVTGTVTGGVLRRPPGRIEGEVRLDAREGGITAGAYRFRFDGPRVGDLATGRFFLLGSGDEVLKSGSFWADLGR